MQYPKGVDTANLAQPLKGNLRYARLEAFGAETLTSWRPAAAMQGKLAIGVEQQYPGGGIVEIGGIFTRRR
jgi:hypothetical protein